jgi:hypothetical protein
MQKRLELFERGVAGWLDFLIVSVDEAADVGAAKVVASLPADLVNRLREDHVIQYPPPSSGMVPIREAAYYVPGADLDDMDRRRRLGARLLHEYFYPTDTP